MLSAYTAKLLLLKGTKLNHKSNIGNGLEIFYFGHMSKLLLNCLFAH